MIHHRVYLPLVFRKSGAGWKVVHDHTSSADSPTVTGSEASGGDQAGYRSTTEKANRVGRSPSLGGMGQFKFGNGQIVLPYGAMLTGVTWTNTSVLPASNYEISLEAMKVEGSDFFCGLTFPAGTNACTFVVGGWGGGVVGISCIDGEDASMNETTKYRAFEKGRWYHVRVRVGSGSIQAWIDDDKVADVATADRKLSMRVGEIELSQPLGIVRAGKQPAPCAISS